MANLTSITELPVVNFTENLHFIVNDNGVAKQVAASAVGGGGGGVFVIDTTSSEYNTTNAEYGNKIKDALLNGYRAFVYDGTAYMLVTGFSLYEDAYGQKLSVATSVEPYGTGGFRQAVKYYKFSATF